MTSSRTLRRDLLIAGAYGAAVIAILVLVRILSTAAPTASQPGNPEPTADQRQVAVPAPNPTSPTTNTSTSAPTPLPSVTGTLGAPAVTVQLKPGVAVTPRAPTPQAARPAATSGLPSALPTAETPSAPETIETTAVAWLNALCAYDWRQHDSATHLRRADIYGDTTMPPAADPFTFRGDAWSQVTPRPTPPVPRYLTPTKKPVGWGQDKAQCHVAKVDHAVRGGPRRGVTGVTGDCCDQRS